MTDKLYSSPHPHLRYMYTFRCGIRISSRTSPISGRKEGLASASSCTSRPSTCKLDRDEHRIISLFTSSHSTSSHRLFRFFKIVLFLSLMNLSPPRPSSAAPHRPQRLAPRPLERQRDAAAPTANLDPPPGPMGSALSNRLSPLPKNLPFLSKRGCATLIK